MLTSSETAAPMTYRPPHEPLARLREPGEPALGSIAGWPDFFRLAWQGRSVMSDDLAVMDEAEIDALLSELAEYPVPEEVAPRKRTYRA